ncbi:signal peptidase I [Enterococcus cecorum]|uniref:Signal peptidase I n=1 Tax=Enterococcus cecorum TaxID=44008 RepID=A0A1Y4QWX2_9ENTE|nr:signal peptidase I [Enterococcus cecorum]MBM6936487.1 signal peptidase I [Enterococcus cecorum]MCJ0601697.1 signal peptidase I [Enterococcus cecorum]MDT2796323.1 signal peptidase I [Enterococcus cecorum]MDZ5587889.1 signal peptidase I [Enterococcus cecorum]OUQ09804.1 signal peptidase I [Enterococcus cecorum]
MDKLRIVMNAILTIVVIFVCSLAALNFFSAPDRPGLFGYKGYTVISGSMKPTLEVGDYIVIKEIPFEKVQKGDIISFYQEHTLVTHRVIERNRDYLQTRGDQNNVNDLIAVTKANYLGKYQFRIKQLGRFLLWMQDPLVYSLIMAAIALRIAVLLLFKK